MTIIKNNPLVKGASGMVGKTVVYREVHGQLIMANAPRKRASLSEQQQVTVAKFKEATQYARKQMADPLAKEEYRKGITQKKHTAHLVAMSDYLNAPVVDYVKAPLHKGAIGDVITIKAKDDFKVIRLMIEILNKNGQVLEGGDAVRFIRKPFIWKYKVSVMNPDIKGTIIRATAFDKPGNKGMGELVL